MTDFFAQMQARCRGEAGVLRPRVPFRFEPVSVSLAAADLTGGPAAEPGWRGAHPDGPFRRPGGPGRAGEPWTGLAAGDGVQPAAGPEPEPAITMTAGPQPAGLRPVRRAGPSREQAAAADLSGTGPADGAAPGGTWRPDQDQGAGGAGATTARPGAPLARDRAAGLMAPPDRPPVLESPVLELSVLEPPVLEPERGTPSARQAVAWTAEPGPGRLGAAAGAAELAARPQWRPGRGDSGGADATTDADAGPSRRRSPWELQPEPAGASRPLSAAAPGPARRRAADQHWARDHGPGEPSGPGHDAITVQVTIGRVEVRAAPPAARAAAAPPPSAGPSLADYLRHRSRSAGARS
jgi:hypothetical protein